MIGLATDREMPELIGGELLFFQALSERTDCKIVIWDDPQESWRDCTQIVIRCTWDYSGRIIEFLKWIDKIEQAGIRLYNSANVLRWNSDKLYLRDLQARGVTIPETTWIPRGKLTADLLAKKVTSPCVLKPTVSAGGYDTYRVTPENIEGIAGLVADVAKSKGFMLQPFIPEVENPGEYSLIFFNKKFSHSVLKTPAPGEFRVQTRYGGEQGAASVPEEIVRQGRFVLDQVPYDDMLLYARVDGILRDGKLILMELELIEPYLFLEFRENAATVLASHLNNQ